MRFLLLAALAAGACAGDDDPGPAAMCRGVDGRGCADDQWCDLASCALNDGAGTCVARPQTCPDVYAPVIGYDGRTYGNACEAHAQGVDDCGPAPPE